MSIGLSRWRWWCLRSQFCDQPQNLLEHLPSGSQAYTLAAAVFSDKSLTALLESLAATSGSNLTFESRLGFPSDLPYVVVSLQAAISRVVAEANDDPKPFAWLADPNKSIVAVSEGTKC